MIRYRFKTKSVKDYRPLIFNPKYPWWCSGYGKNCAIIIAWLPPEEILTEYWDDAFDVELEKHPGVVFSDRFPKPQWYEETESN